MKNLFKRGALFIGVAMFFSVIITSCDDEEKSINQKIQKPEVKEAVETTVEGHGDIIPGSYIVTLKEGSVGSNMRTMKGYAIRQAVAKPMMSDMITRAGLQLDQLKHVYSAEGIMGFSVDNVDSEGLAKLKSMSNVETVTPNRVIALVPWYCSFFPWLDVCNEDPEPSPDQTTPWGITRVGGPTNMSNSNKRAFVIDTGIDFDHPDLNVNTSLSTSFVGSNGNDGNGHGTHVAGTIGAIDNSIGVVGVAAGIEVVAVQVLNSQGSGSYAGVVSGIDYVAQTANPGDAANLSLGGPTDSSVDNAIRRLGNAGVFVSLAAGNETQNANNVSPARTNGTNIYTVSSMTSSNSISYFSNYGNPPVDYAAPGSSIESTWLNGGYNTISGTSMAAPHVAGLLLVTNGNIQTDGYISGDPDGNPDPIAHN
ncbi:S8 family serine peptidase [Fulvivirga maritima]|uniref:S8 family serine peptidase n=1 Tax=Fulvivirga maritima TaxID=2904247 RepID=UPI001F2E6A91|nr:S8 family serine peptidase [Fulvivirga maritima]UII26596.1 S8 family serine peptidase [Fulvivirga maritima]